jgi:glycosyltransferase involved in cell wall biosynthesis
MESSVVIIARNSETTIGNCIRSVKNQSLPASEIIVVDNGSTDSTSTIAKGNHVKVLSEPIPGRSRARNNGILEARGEIVVFIDSDAYAHHDWLKYLLSTFNRTRFAGVAGNVCAANPNILIPHLIDMVIRDSPHYGTGNIAYRKKVLMEVGLFNRRLKSAEDVEIAWRILQAGHRIGFEPKAIVYHFHPNSLRKFLRQQEEFGQWSMIARKTLGMPTQRQRLLMMAAPLTIFSHVKEIIKHPLLPFFLTMASIAYARGLSRGVSIWRNVP